MVDKKIEILAKNIMTEKLNPEQIAKLNAFVFNSNLYSGEASAKFRGRFDGYLAALEDLQIITEGEVIVLEEYFIKATMDDAKEARR